MIGLLAPDGRPFAQTLLLSSQEIRRPALF
jgi:hypothetical protein